MSGKAMVNPPQPRQASRTWTSRWTWTQTSCAI